MRKYIICLVLVLFIFNRYCLCKRHERHIRFSNRCFYSTFTDLKNNISNSANEFNMQSDYKFNEKTDKDFLNEGNNYINVLWKILLEREFSQKIHQN